MKAFVCDACQETRRGHALIKTIERDRDGRTREIDLCSTFCAARRYVGQVVPRERPMLTEIVESDDASRPPVFRDVRPMAPGATPWTDGKTTGPR